MAKHSSESRKVLRALNDQLADGLEWTAQEREVLALIQTEIDRKCDHERDYDQAETPKERLAIGREIRLTKISIARLMAMVSTEEVVPKNETPASARARRAANARWHGGSPTSVQPKMSGGYSA